jgi:hypothetical protein
MQVQAILQSLQIAQLSEFNLHLVMQRVVHSAKAGVDKPAKALILASFGPVSL